MSKGGNFTNVTKVRYKAQLKSQEEQTELITLLSFFSTCQIFSRLYETIRLWIVLDGQLEP